MIGFVHQVLRMLEQSGMAGSPQLPPRELSLAGELYTRPRPLMRRDAWTLARRSGGLVLLCFDRGCTVGEDQLDLVSAELDALSIPDDELGHWRYRTASGGRLIVLTVAITTT